MSYLSRLPGQRLSSCLCYNQQPEFTPTAGIGRGAPELDVFEAASSPQWGPTVSQSHQFAPFDQYYTPDYNYTRIFSPDRTVINTYRGGFYQQAVSGVTTVSSDAFEGNGWVKFGVEWKGGENGWATWYVDDQPTWQVDARAVGPNPSIGIGQRLIANEPMVSSIHGYSWIITF